MRLPARSSAATARVSRPSSASGGEDGGRSPAVRFRSRSGNFPTPTYADPTATPRTKRPYDPVALSATGAAPPPGTGRRAYDPRRNNGDARGGAIPYLPTYLQVILLRAKLTFSAERSAAPPKTVPKGKCRILAPRRTFRTSILRIRTLYHAIFADFCRKDRMYSQLILLPNG